VVFDSGTCDESIAGDPDTHACNSKTIAHAAKKETRVNNNTMPSK
jgi:hypothetical protein